MKTVVWVGGCKQKIYNMTTVVWVGGCKHKIYNMIIVVILLILYLHTPSNIWLKCTIWGLKVYQCSYPFQISRKHMWLSSSDSWLAAIPLPIWIKCYLPKADWYKVSNWFKSDFWFCKRRFRVADVNYNVVVVSITWN